jgi:hypothetical protein
MHVKTRKFLSAAFCACALLFAPAHAPARRAQNPAPNGAAPAAGAQKVTLTVQADAPGKQISPDLFGIFFEDLNYAADGGRPPQALQPRIPRRRQRGRDYARV